MCTTLHLLLKGRHPHELYGQYITRDHMRTLHRALIEWLILGTPPALWQICCIHRDILPSAHAHTCPYSLLSIAATTSLPKGQPWRQERSTLVGPPPAIILTPSVTGGEPHTPQHTVLSPLPSARCLSFPRNRLEDIEPTHGSIHTEPQPHTARSGTSCVYCPDRTHVLRTSET